MELCFVVYFKTASRINPETGELDIYYRLVESYRKEDGRVCHRTLLSVGFLPGILVEQLNKIQSHLNDMYKRRSSLFSETDARVQQLSAHLWQRLIEEQRIDLKIEEQEKVVKVNSLRHRDVREIGSEWLCYRTWNQLGLSLFLADQGWSDEQIKLAATQVVSRAVYPASELSTSKWICQNSAICELTGYDEQRMTKDKLYESALRLYQLKDELEKHLSHQTNTLFDLQDKIILYDLTNTYFEGRKAGSRLAQYGRSKEKRNDAKLVVLAMVVNVEGFIKYSAIHEGNIADCNTLSAMIDKLAVHTVQQSAIIVLDAGIATEENLSLIRRKGYHYLCVSRSKLKDYTPVQNRLTVLLETRSRQEVRLKAVQSQGQTDYFLEVKSGYKAQTEVGMLRQFRQRYEAELQKIKASLQRKGGVKQSDKVHQRIGRARQKYPSVHHLYKIEVIESAKGIVDDITWEPDETRLNKKDESIGIYFLRTDLNMEDEVVVWNIYNTIREIESSFRCLKTDLDLRPIYHKRDKSTMAHLHLGILAYWLVNTMRHQFKGAGIHCSWREIVRIGNTQKMITTTGQNGLDRTITIRRCSEPNEELKRLMIILSTPYKPFTKRKSVVLKPERQIPETRYNPVLDPN